MTNINVFWIHFISHNNDLLVQKQELAPFVAFPFNLTWRQNEEPSENVWFAGLWKDVIDYGSCFVETF